MKGSCLVLGLILAAIGHIQSQLFETDTVREHESAKLFCSARLVAPNNISKNIHTVPKLQVLRKPVNEPKFYDLVTYDWNFFSNPFAGKSLDSWIETSNGRIIVTATGMEVNGSVLGNRNFIAIEITFKDVMCEDNAIYRCLATFSDPPLNLYYHVDNTLKVKGHPVEAITGSIIPDKTLYREDDSVTVVCRAHGRENVTLLWRYQACPTDLNPNSSMLDWPHASDITDVNNGTFVERGCTFTRYQSELRIAHLSNGSDTICLIQCVAGIEGPADGVFVEHKQWNVTIEYADSSRNWELYVFAGASALLALGLLVLVLYCCRGKKSAPEKPDQNEDVAPGDSKAGTPIDSPIRSPIPELDLVEFALYGSPVW